MDLELDQDTSARLPSCDGCRDRKLKCSREKPSCTNCSRLDVACVYDAHRSKPGLKRGTIDKLSRRVDALERRLLESADSLDLGPGPPAETTAPVPGLTTDTSLDGSSKTALSTLAQHIQNLSSNISALSQSLERGLRHPASHLSPPDGQRNYNGKRQRLDGEKSPIAVDEAGPPGSLTLLDSSSDILSGDNLEALLDAYFVNVHPWIPMIHCRTFRRRLRTREQGEDPPLILHAILVGALRFLKPGAIWLSSQRIQALVERSRNKIILMASDGLSVEKLQALIILAFTHIGSGEPLKAWPIVASLTRMVEFLKMSRESQEPTRPIAFWDIKPLPPPADWIEEEERRRVFWNVFTLDRICSINTGWNIGLTADNVSRRLPVCGTNWNEETPAVTPFFGIWDKSAAKIGNSVVFIPERYANSNQPTEVTVADNDNIDPVSGKMHQTTGTLDTSTIGAFAYYVESLESLCRINLYFLQQKIDFSNRREVTSWLTRFKELDLRLVHWKMFLPPKWKDPNVPPKATTALDPNMSLAHITHNTSMILLHQRIGYPEPELKSIKLPNFYSAETCHSAATETANITRKYLAYAPVHMPLSPQFAFCAYISARVLLVHSRYYGIELDPLFSVILECLNEMSARWCCDVKHPSTPLPAKFRAYLQELYVRWWANPNMPVSVVGPVEADIAETPCADRFEDGDLAINPSQGLQGRVRQFTHPTPFVPSQNLATPPETTGLTPPVFNSTGVGESIAADQGRAVLQTEVEAVANWTSPSIGSTGTGGPDELSHILRSLDNEQFMEMDRVISFDDFNLASISSHIVGIPPPSVPPDTHSWQ